VPSRAKDDPVAPVFGNVTDGAIGAKSLRLAWFVRSLVHGPSLAIRRISMSVRALGLAWAVVACPIIGWAAAWYGNVITHGRLGVGDAVFLFGILPAGLAAAGNAVLNRGVGPAIRAALVAASICLLGFVIFVLVFLLTVPPGFFE
jgi:hypothetical protein